jgi:hypothetical protein
MLADDSSATEIVNAERGAKPVSRRCLVCRLPADLREEVERDRLRHWKTYDRLAQELRSEHQYVLSPASLRRHFGRHVDPNSQFDAAATEDRSQENVSTPFDPLINAPVLDDRLVVEVLARALIERLQHLERARQTTRNPAQAERLMTASLKEMQALERALRRREELNQPRRELTAKFQDFLRRMLEATQQACAAFLSDYLSQMDAAVAEHLNDYSHPERLVRKMREFRRDWSQTLGACVMDAIRPIGEETMASLR